MMNSSRSNFLADDTNRTEIAKRLLTTKSVFMSVVENLEEVALYSDDLKISKSWPGAPIVFGIGKSFNYSRVFNRK